MSDETEATADGVLSLEETLSLILYRKETRDLQAKKLKAAQDEHEHAEDALGDAMKRLESHVGQAELRSKAVLFNHDGVPHVAMGDTFGRVSIAPVAGASEVGKPA